MGSVRPTRLDNWKEKTFSADIADVLGTQPISALAIYIRALQNGTTEGTLANLLATLTRVQITSAKYGVLVNWRSTDLFWYNVMVLGHDPAKGAGGNAPTTDNAPRWLGPLYVPFGRWIGDDTYGLPAHGRGDLNATLVYGSLTNIDTVDVTLTELRMPGAAFSHCFVRKEITDTPAATGDKSYELESIFDYLRDIQFLFATQKSNAAHTTGIEYVSVTTAKAAAMEYHAWQVHYESMAMGKFGRQAGVLFASTGSNLEGGVHSALYAYLDFDPNNDCKGLPAIKGNDPKVIVNFGATDATRIIPTYLLKV